MRRPLAIAVFSLAATGSTLAGAGLVVAPHVDPPGTPAFHDHMLAAYRFPIFLMHLQQLYARIGIAGHSQGGFTSLWIGGARVNAEDRRGYTALTYAAIRGDVRQGLLQIHRNAQIFFGCRALRGFDATLDELGNAETANLQLEPVGVHFR